MVKGSGYFGLSRTGTRFSVLDQGRLRRYGPVLSWSTRLRREPVGGWGGGTYCVRVFHPFHFVVSGRVPGDGRWVCRVRDRPGLSAGSVVGV